MTHLCLTYLSGKNQCETALKKLKSLGVSCLVMEIFDLYFCLHMDSGDAAESTAINCSWERMELLLLT